MRIHLFVVAFCLVLMSAPAALWSQWAEGGVGICEQTYSQSEIAMIPDGDGGAIMTWRDWRTGSYYDIYAQRVDANGYPLWTADGVAVCVDASHQYSPQLVSDGSGGAIITWRDSRGAADDIYAQRIDANGNPLWTANGVSVSSATNGQYDPEICTDQAGGAIIVWRDARNGQIDIYAQRIDEDGNQLWTTDGVPICTDGAQQYTPTIAPEISGGAVIAWRDYRNGNYDIYAQRLTSLGTTTWNYNGVAVCTAANTQQTPVICSDGTYGAIISWMDARGSDSDIYAQKVDGSGFTLWTSQGVVICSASGNQYYPEIAYDEAFGAYISWYDNRSTEADIYVQRINGLGTCQWTANGEPVCTSPGNQMGQEIVLGNDGLLVSWKDGRNGITHVFMQKIDASGSPMWTVDGIPVASYHMGSFNQEVVPDGSGGAIVAWEQVTVFEPYDVFANRIERNGYWGYPSPVITAVRDVPGDQGGYINVAWDASRLDPWPEESIDEYTVWRAIDEEAAMALVSAGGSLHKDVPSPDKSPSGPVVRIETAASGEYYWRLISTIGAAQLESYSEVVPSLFDSTSVCTEYHYFQVIAYSTTPGEYWMSEPDSGRSVDNLAPAVPLSLAGEQSFSPEGLQLTWDPNSESDLAGYNIYRGTSSGFVPGPGNFVTATPDTAAFDGEWSWEAGYWYKVAAVDIHGNESPFAAVGPDAVTGDDPMPAPDATFLAQNWPNPFNPCTTIEFGLRESGHVSLRIYDAAGRLVRSLIDESRTAGQYSAAWNGKDQNGNSVSSGVYFYMLKAGTFEETRKMILLR
jgi:hypothetical protein